MTARPATDPDLWWHLKTGQWIVETGHIPRTDPFSFTRAGAPWISHEWLSEVVFYEIWRHASWAGLIIFASLVTTAGFLLLYLRCAGPPHWAAAATALGALACAPAWGVRPQMFTFLLASLLLWLIEQGETRPWRLLWIPPIFLLWLNLHAGFALGPVLTLAYVLGLVWEAVAGDTNWKEALPYIGRLLLVVAACLLVIPLNPSGSALYLYPVDVLRSGGMRSLIVEWASPDFHEFRYAPFLVLCLALLVAFARSDSRPNPRVLIPLLGALVAALDAVRHIPIFVLFAVPVLVAALPGFASYGPIPPPSRPNRLQPVYRGAIVLLLALFCFVRWSTLIRSQSQSEAALFPKAAVDFLASQRVSGHLFAYYDWGGYSIWKLYPDCLVFVDGRADLYGDDLLDQFKAAIQLRLSWHEVLDRWKVTTVMVPTSSALAQALALDPGWHSEYRDAQATVFRRIRPPEPDTRARNPEVPSQAGKKVQKSLPELS